MRTRYIAWGCTYLFKRTLLFAVIFTYESANAKYSATTKLTQSLHENIASWVSGRVEIK